MMVANRSVILVLGGASEGDRLTALLRDSPALLPLLVRPPNRSGAGLDQPAMERTLDSREELVDLMTGTAAVVIAAHPFSGAFSDAASEVAQSLGLPVLRLVREAWRPGPQDSWIPVDNARIAAQELVRNGWDRAFVALGRDQLAPFLGPNGRDLTIRAPGPGPLPEIRRGRVLTDPGPFSAASEAMLFQKHRIEVLVTRNVGGRGGWPKLQAARVLKLPVLLLRRPALPQGVDVRHTPQEALDWLMHKLGLEIGNNVA